MDRRELLRGAGKLGLGAAAAGYLLNQAQTEALAADFDWQANKGKTVNLLLNKHPYADAMIANLDAFKQLTGMDVKYDVFPEDVYFDKVDAALSSGSDQYDAFMTGAYQTWQLWPGRLDRRPERVHLRPGQDQPELQLGRRPAEPARLDLLVGRAVRGAGRRRRQAVGDPMGLRAELDRLQQAHLRRSQDQARRATCRSWSSRRR